MSTEEERPNTTGLQTGDPVLGAIAEGAGLGTSAGINLGGLSKWDRLRQYFKQVQPTEVAGNFRREPTPFYLDTPMGISRILTADYIERQAEERETRAERINRNKERERERLKDLATEFYGREPSPGEMNELWLLAVDEAEAADNLGIEESPWDALERFAVDPNRPGADEEAGPTTTTSTHRRINLTDPLTAKGIIQSALRGALGRRASDDEIQQFTNALRQLERENPEVSTTTTTRTPEGDTSSQTVTEGSSTSPTAVAEAWLDEELNAEIDVYRAATDYFRVAQQLAEGVV